MSPGSWWIINLRNSPLIIVKNLVFLTLRRSLFQSNRNICRVGRIRVDRTVLCKYSSFEHFFYTLIFSLQITGNGWILLFIFLFQINVWLRFRKYYTYKSTIVDYFFSSIRYLTCNLRSNPTYLYFFTAIQIQGISWQSEQSNLALLRI